jgi:predicted kinase
MELVLIRGLPGSGKTTMAKTFVGYDHYESDQYFEKDGEYRFNPLELQKAHSACLKNAKKSMRNGRPCVVSNTFTRIWEMKPYIDAAKRMNVPVRIIEAKGSWKNCHGVPEETIEKMKARWENL